MESSFLTQLKDFLKKKKNRKVYLAVLLCLAVAVAGGTVLALRNSGHAMNYTQKILSCPLVVHQHTQSCKNSEGELVCGYADYVVHTHNADCYDPAGNLVCKLPEIEEHKHTESCWTDEKTLICGLEETPGHEHTEECYTVEQGELTCTKEEHTHGEECYDEAGELICELEEHTHGADCYASERVLTCGLEEGEGTHTHTDSCYETQRVLSCGKLEMHTHTESCFKEDENGKKQLVCKEIELTKHVHENECFTVVELTPEEVAAMNSVAPEEETPEGPESSETGEVAGDGVIEGGETSADEPQQPQVEAPEGEFTLTYTDENVSVTAAFDAEANIPEEAQLQVYAVTPESDPDRYAERVDGALDAAGIEGDSSDVNAMVLNIGFFLPDGTEIEPEAPVSLTIQFLQNGIPEGAPVKVVHFGEEGTQTYETSQSEEGASFAVDGFSDFVLIAGPVGDTPSATASDTVKHANVGGLVGENNEMRLGSNCYYEFTAELGAEGWELELPATVTWLDTEPITVKNTVQRTDSKGNTYTEEVTVGTITTTADGKVVYTPDPNCPKDAYLTDYTLKENFNVSGTKRGGLQFPGIAETVQFEPRDLAPFISDAKLTQDGIELEDGDKVVVGEKYTYSVKFQETGTDLLQEFSTPMYFNLPDGVTAKVENNKPIYDKEYGPDPVGWYSVDENGVVTVEFDENYLNSKSNLSMELNFDMTVTEESEGKVDFPWDNGDLSKTFETDPVPDAELTKTAGAYNPADPNGPCIDYSVKLEITKGAVVNPKLSDTMKPGLSYRQGSGKITVYDDTGKDITDTLDPAPSLKKTADGWEMENIPEPLSKGWKIEVSYQADINFDSITGAPDNGNFNFTAENDAGFTGNSPVDSVPPLERNDNTKTNFNDQRNDKSGSLEEGEGLNWEILVGSGATDVRGTSVKDTLSGKHWVDEEHPLQLKWEDASGHNVHVYDIPWDDPNLEILKRDSSGRITEFRYNIPDADATNADGTLFWDVDDEGTPRQWQQGDHVKLEYYTDYEPSATEASNTAIVETGDDQFKDDSVIGIGAGTISKSGTKSADGQYMEYTVVLDIPSASELVEKMGAARPSETVSEEKIPRFYIVDQLEFSSVKAYDENNNERYVRYFVENLPEDVIITATLEDGTVINFEKDGTGENSFRIAQYGVDYSTDWPDKEKGHREFQIWFNTYLANPENGYDYHDSYWTIDQPCTLTITYKVRTDSKLYLEDEEGTKNYFDTDLTLNDILNQGFTLGNEVWAKGKDGEFKAKHRFKGSRPEFVTTKEAKLLPADPNDPFEQEIEYRVQFNGFMTNVDTGKYSEVYIDPATFFLEDTFDSRLEYVPGSLQIEVYAPDSYRQRYTFKYEGDPTLTENGGTTTMTATADKFNDRTYNGDAEWDTKTSLGDYMKSKRDALYLFVYRLRVKKEAYTGESITFDNEANVYYNDTFSGDDASVQLTSDPLMKDGRHDKDEYGADIVVYSIEVNPGAIDMVTTSNDEANPGRYTLTDKMDDILILNSDSVKVYRVEADGTKVPLELVTDQSMVKPSADYYVFQPGEENTFKLILPDEQHILIEYNANVDANKGLKVSVTNTVELEGGMSLSDTSNAEFVVDGENASITGDAKMRLFKKDASTGNYIGGAEFKLYSTAEDGALKAAVDGTEYSFAEYQTLTPDAITGADVAEDTSSKGNYYLLQETQAPKGYKPTEEPFVVVFGAKEEGDPDQVTLSYQGKEYLAKVHYITRGNNVIIVDNTPEAYQLPRTGGEGWPLFLGGSILLLAGAVGITVLLRRRRTGA